MAEGRGHSAILERDTVNYTGTQSNITPFSKSLTQILIVLMVLNCGWLVSNKYCPNFNE